MVTVAHPYPNTDGLCFCGCGERVRPGNRYIKTHAARRFALCMPFYAEQDTGYNTPCWIWQRYKNPAGYGLLNAGGKTRIAHRWYFELANGPIPEGLECDHLCRQRSCVNPDHIDLVPHIVNSHRAQPYRTRKAPNVTCVYCGRAFRRDPSLIRAKNNYCDKTCYTAHRSTITYHGSPLHPRDIAEQLCMTAEALVKAHHGWQYAWERHQQLAQTAAHDDGMGAVDAALHTINAEKKRLRILLKSHDALLKNGL